MHYNLCNLIHINLTFYEMGKFEKRKRKKDLGSLHELDFDVISQL